MSTGQNTEDYKRQFCQEIHEIIDQVSEDILKAETAPDDRDLLNAIFRGIHTIKGSAGMFGMDALGQFAHHFEELLGGVREGTITLTSDIVDIVLSGTDAIGAMASAYEKGEKPAVDEGLLERLAGLLVHDKSDQAADSHSENGPKDGAPEGQAILLQTSPSPPGTLTGALRITRRGGRGRTSSLQGRGKLHFRAIRKRLRPCCIAEKPSINLGALYPHCRSSVGTGIR